MGKYELCLFRRDISYWSHRHSTFKGATAKLASCCFFWSSSSWKRTNMCEKAVSSTHPPAIYTTSISPGKLGSERLALLPSFPTWASQWGTGTFPIPGFARPEEEGCSELCQTVAVGPPLLPLHLGRKCSQIYLAEMPESSGAVFLNLLVSEPNTLGPNTGSAPR